MPRLRLLLRPSPASQVSAHSRSPTCASVLTMELEQGLIKVSDSRAVHAAGLHAAECRELVSIVFAETRWRSCTATCTATGTLETCHGTCKPCIRDYVQGAASTRPFAFLSSLAGAR
mmetsp:Transcript_35818/g.71901  ORF Transcript_35818/g.71901 Transcript_35818/m.71901 type:complete len:117 (+) Transcript_35818:267-617(+)|eukprot:CAMPEP_0196723388 /NCGR_PEP_ID=MMETSP1091-20130531/5516_1 /TAXON_ID=302021 /ORGANISM="Rhodomonas sp., Strain CCMP768" /LENGTH=116 /DNA_ID=CAMNT_0042065303 /DNA_START=247 /DNA_END=600 /DNA_ORIENTATION=-